MMTTVFLNILGLVLSLLSRQPITAFQNFISSIEKPSYSFFAFSTLHVELFSSQSTVAAFLNRVILRSLVRNLIGGLTNEARDAR